MKPYQSKSFWLSDAGVDEMTRPLCTTMHCDVLIIGGGIAGLSAAWHIKKDSPGTRVVVLEAEAAGYGASGRSGGWIMTQFGLDQLAVAKRFGMEKAQAAFHYTRRAVDYTRELIQVHGLDSDYRHPGVMRIAFDDRWTASLETLMKLYRQFGAHDVQWLDRHELADEFAGNDRFKAGLFEPNMGMIHPGKHVKGLKKLAVSAGVELYEQTPAIELGRTTGGVVVETPRATVTADRLIIATNAYSHLLQGRIGRELSRRQTPVIARSAVTVPLTDRQWESIGWHRRNAIESTLDLFHWMSPTLDGRIQYYFIYYGGFPQHGELDPVISAEGARVSTDHLARIFPSLRGVKMEQTWGGHFSATRDLVPHLSFLGDKRVMYVAGCWGHGNAISHLHGQTISDLVLGKTTDLTSLWIIDRKPQDWPIAPFGWLGRAIGWNAARRRVKRQVRGSVFE